MSEILEITLPSKKVINFRVKKPYSIEMLSFTLFGSILPNDTVVGKCTKCGKSITIKDLNK